MALKPRVLAAIVGAVFATTASANNLYNELTFLQNNHPLIASSQAQKTAAEQNYRASRGSALPTIELSAQTGYEEQSRPNDINTSEDTQAASISITQRLFDFGATSGLVDAAEARIGSASSVSEQTCLLYTSPSPRDA